METLTELRNRFAKDRYATEGLGAEIAEAGEGYAVCQMSIRPEHCNALGIPMGGVVFTLADFAFAVAANQGGRQVVTQASQVTFLTPARGDRLTATARAVREGSRVCFYQVTVHDDREALVAQVTINGYVVHSEK